MGNVLGGDSIILEYLAPGLGLDWEWEWDPLGMGIPALRTFLVPGTTQKKFLGTDGYQVPARKKILGPMGTGYRENFHLYRPLLQTKKGLKVTKRRHFFYLYRFKLHFLFNPGATDKMPSVGNKCCIMWNFKS